MKTVEDLDPLGVSGTMISYYFTCKRKLWLFSKDLDMEGIQPTLDLIIGKLLNLKSYKQEKHKEFEIEDCVIDFITFKDEVIVHETKKSRKFEEAHIWQTKYYVFILRRYGLNVTRGIIHYPKLMRKMEVVFSEEDQKKILEAISGVKEILALRKPPPVLNKGFCQKCSYYDLCYA